MKKFFLYQAFLTAIAIANDVVFRSYLHPFLPNRYILAVAKAPVDLVILYFVFKLYGMLDTKLRYKILLHIAAFIVGALFIGLTGSFMGL